MQYEWEVESLYNTIADLQNENSDLQFQLENVHAENLTLRSTIYQLDQACMDYRISIKDLEERLS